jgi:hypothetical protein
MNGEHDEPTSDLIEPTDAYLASLTDAELGIVARDRLVVWRALLDATEYDAAEGLEHFVGEVRDEAEHRLTQVRAESDALAAFLSSPASPMRGTL